ncbi:MAG TPA: response regulator transcription factor [Candidatus Sulfotelmatobacter sp.]|jgi:DNA-binding NarL/FixJ family response regulator|nr:response regulator transcription factor [Candidatus Sulfotelmatobacter sp.]
MKRIITVSIVDDEADLRKHIAGYLSAAGNIRCISAYASAEDALKHLPEDKPDVVLMDINLGEMDGIECVRRLTVLMPEAQVLMLTVFEDSEQIFRALAAGASGYLLKRLSPKKLLEAIEEVLAGGSPMSASIARKVVHSFKAAPARGDESADLSDRERAVLDGLAAGLAYKQIADQLGISIHTVRNYIRRIYEKLHVCSRTEAVAKFLRK